MCFSLPYALMPLVPMQDVDLVIVEFAVNDPALGEDIVQYGLGNVDSNSLLLGRIVLMPAGLMEVEWQRCHAKPPTRCVLLPCLSPCSGHPRRQDVAGQPGAAQL